MIPRLFNLQLSTTLCCCWSQSTVWSNHQFCSLLLRYSALLLQLQEKPIFSPQKQKKKIFATQSTYSKKFDLKNWNVLIVYETRREEKVWFCMWLKKCLLLNRWNSKICHLTRCSLKWTEMHILKRSIKEKIRMIKKF